MDIAVQRPSARILGRLRKGHAVRLAPHSSGEGLNLIVDPSKYDEMSHSFRQGKSLSVALHPTEIAGSGLGGDLWKSIKKGASSAAKAVSKVATPANLATAGKYAMKYGAPALAVAAGQPELLPVIGAANMAMGNGLGGSFDLARLGAMTGQKLGALRHANMGTALANREQGRLAQVMATARGQQGNGLYAQAGAHPMGRGIRTRRHNLHEMSSVGAMGNLLGGSIPPALQSQANSQNFQFGVRLPVAYQSAVHSGSGLGGGLYA